MCWVEFVAIMNKLHPVSMSWVPLYNNEERKVPFYRDAYLNPVDPFIRFVLCIATHKNRINQGNGRDQAFQSLVAFYAYPMKSLLVFLNRPKSKITWDQVSDAHLNEWYEWELGNIIKQNASKNDLKTAMRTANRKLTAIYQFYGWAQCVSNLLPSNHVGNNGKIKSSLPEAYRLGLHSGPIPRVNRKQHRVIFDNLYPLVREGTGEATGDYTATDDDVNSVIEYFYAAAKSTYLAERNVLMFDCTHMVGWRSNAIASLTVDQFLGVDISNDELSAVLVKPSRQKFGYNLPAEVPLSLFVRIVAYIEKERKEFMLDNNLTEAKVGGMLFLTQQGKPVKAKRIGETIAHAYQCIGLPRKIGAGAHSGRRKKAVDKTLQEVAWRAKLGQPIDPMTVALAVSQTLNQKNIESSAAYTKALGSLSTKNLEAKLERQNAELLGEVAELRREAALMRAQIMKFGRESDS